jgi:beta-carotene 3-hydroxylase
MILNIAIVVATFLFMEFMAWFTHKYVMHGFLWSLHEDHHVPPGNIFQKNDAFFLIFAVPSILLMYFGMKAGLDFKFFIGLGILFYGLAYFFVHDLFIHQRIKVLRNTNNKYLKGLRRAHKVHHKHTGKQHGECFGMLLVPFQYFRNKF